MTNYIKSKSLTESIKEPGLLTFQKGNKWSSESKQVTKQKIQASFARVFDTN